MIIFTQHALEKLAQRSIRKDFVLRTLKNPDKVAFSFGGRQIAFKQMTKLNLCVVFKKQGKHIIVVTEYYENIL